MGKTKFLKILMSIIIFSLVMVITGCGDGSGGNSTVNPEEQTTISVTGKIVGKDNNPIAGATVTITSDPVTVTTNQWGEFSAKVVPGEHTITVTEGNVTLYRSTFTAQEGSHIALGSITPNYPDSSGDTQAPTVPGSATATAASSTQINLNWISSTDNAGVTAYRIFRNGTQLPDTVAGMTYSDTGLSASTQYCYTVSAGDAKGNWSAQSVQSCATTLAAGSTGDTQSPTVPGSITATVTSSSQITVSWIGSTDNIGVTGYRLFRGGIFLKHVAGTSTTDIGLSASTQYCYTVSAGDAAGNWSAQSTQSCVTTLAGGGTGDMQAPTIPGSAIATAASSTQINLNWGASTDNVGVTGYRLYRGGVFLKPVAGTSTTDTGLSANTPYCYTISAGDAAGNWSALSTQSCATTQASTDTIPPTVVSVSPLSNAVNVATGTRVSATFSESVITDASSIAVSVGTSGITIPGTITTRDDDTVVVFTPDPALAYGTSYRVTISGIRDITGNTLASDYSWSFTTMFAGGIPELLMQFMNDPTQSNYNILMNAIAATGTTKEAYLYKAISELLDIFNSPKVRQIIADAGLPEIGFDTDMELLDALYNISGQNGIVDQYFKSSPNLYSPDSQALFLETENRLSQVDALLALADGIDLDISFGPLNTVHFDSIDVKVLRAMTNLAKAYFVYLQSLNLTITNYNITYNNQTYDLRDLYTNKPVTDDYAAMLESAWLQVLNNNTSLLTYKDRSATSKLAQFRTTLQTAFDFYGSAVTDIQGKTAEERRDRFRDAFSLDDDYTLKYAQLMRDEVFRTAMECMTGISTQFILPRPVYLSHEFVNGNDGFYYLNETYNIYLESYCPDGMVSEITIFNLFGSGTGADKTPRDMILEVTSLAEDTDYNPYTLCGSVLRQDLMNVVGISWDDFLEPFTIPLAYINIDGISSDWSSVPDIPELSNATSTYKIARDTGDNVYLFVSSTYVPPTGGSYWSWNSHFNVWMQYGDDTPEEEYLYIACSIDGSLYNTAYTVSAFTWDGVSNSSPNEIRKLNDTTGLELRFAKLSDLLKAGSENAFYVSEYLNGVTYYDQINALKFLP